ncbi:hypothetical protein [Corynebacterium cystitidis]|nr:hypothetical protein [Corynebacterium cystitidis]
MKRHIHSVVAVAVATLFISGGAVASASSYPTVGGGVSGALLGAAEAC